VATESDQYLNALAYADQAIATLIDGLRARRRYDNTLFVIFGDHGEAFGQHPGNAGHTFFVFDENVRVPLLFVLPGVTTGPLRAASIASLVDVVPSILDLLGIADDTPRDGASLLRPRDRLALFLTDYSLGWLGLRDGCFKYLYDVDDERSKLFDLCSDPQEQRELSGAYPEQVAAYREHLEEWSTVVRTASNSKMGHELEDALSSRGPQARQ
jgi:arylsulfatase A-like enzyme